MFKSSTDRETLMLCCMVFYLTIVTVIIFSLILITHVCAAVIDKRLEFN